MSLCCDDFYVTPQGYYVIKVITWLLHQGYYVTVTLTNHGPFQNQPTLDTKKMHFCSSESRESRMFGISALKTIVLKNKTKLFSICNWSILTSDPSYVILKIAYMVNRTSGIMDRMSVSTSS